jgi:hypothetical protein
LNAPTSPPLTPRVNLRFGRVGDSFARAIAAARKVSHFRESLIPQTGWTSRAIRRVVDGENF